MGKSIDEGGNESNGEEDEMINLETGSKVTLEVIAGPSLGHSCSRISTNSSMVPFIIGIGRLPPNELVLEDAEVSGNHAKITWNCINSKWEIVDLGTLNGTLLNSKAIHHPDLGCRQRGVPVELADGDVITFGPSSKVSVRISKHMHNELSFGVGVASDPMALRRGGKELPMEDMYYIQCPLQCPVPGIEQFGLFGIFDGHGGAEAAKAASKMLPQSIIDILLNSDKRNKVISLCDASDVLKEAFSITEAALDHEYEGCTATVLLVWIGSNKCVFAQCANVGDSACVISDGEKHVTMTEDHRLLSVSEVTRFQKMGNPVKDGQTRILGLSIARMLGDKFPKEKDSRFSAEPYVSQVVQVSSGAAFAILASDGLWDVMTTKKAVQHVLQAKEKCNEGPCSELVAKALLHEADTLRTRDNTTVIFIDFGSTKIVHAT